MHAPYANLVGRKPPSQKMPSREVNDSLPACADAGNHTLAEARVKCE
jgi:hypothetical protein